MLVPYKPSYEKIAMGLLSYMPEEKEIKKLQQTIRRYETDEDWQLFLWKKDDIIGVIGIHLLQDSTAELCHLCINPSYREEGLGKEMIEAIRKKVDGKLIPTTCTMSFYRKCGFQYVDL
ncbi:GNAT family N-acetyltransferase [Anaerobacillus sp. MEB173]|uniref:GNAT family N-acetyltransferase n=1 Tax=Anaerobacillus sp. MEB173 TaxID=3383345 RepID=UPI003F93586D